MLSSTSPSFVDLAAPITAAAVLLVGLALLVLQACESDRPWVNPAARAVTLVATALLATGFLGLSTPWAQTVDCVSMLMGLQCWLFHDYERPRHAADGDEPPWWPTFEREFWAEVRRQQPR
jgi:hypothetical protein